MRWALDSILARIERGMVVEIRFLPPPAEPDVTAGTPEARERAKTYAELKTISHQLEFHIPPGEPVLQLPPADPPAASERGAEEVEDDLSSGHSFEDALPPM
jgi:hypothetical protein